METEFKMFLRKRNHAASTTHIYSSIIRKIRRENSGLHKFNYRDVLEMLGRENSTSKSGCHKQTSLAALKSFYTFLNERGIRDDHPCMTLTLKHKVPQEIISSDLFSMSELNLLFDREERYSNLNLKNKVLFSLLIHQGLTPLEISKLKVSNIYLDQGYIKIPRSLKLCGRKLAIDPKQLIWLEKYLEVYRPKLIRTSTDILILGKNGLPITCDALHYIVSTTQPLFPTKELTAMNIRQSVIAFWLNEMQIPLEQVQLMAGHKWISSTQRYLFHSVEKDLLVLRRVHPMG